jgi:hypothetical protein
MLIFSSIILHFLSNTTDTVDLPTPFADIKPSIPSMFGRNLDRIIEITPVLVELWQYFRTSARIIGLLDVTVAFV